MFCFILHDRKKAMHYISFLPAKSVSSRRSSDHIPDSNLGGVCSQYQAAFTLLKEESIGPFYRLGRSLEKVSTFTKSYTR